MKFQNEYFYKIEKTQIKLDYYQSEKALEIEQKNDAITASKLHMRNLEQLKRAAWNQKISEGRKQAAEKSTRGLIQSEDEINKEPIGKVPKLTTNPRVRRSRTTTRRDPGQLTYNQALKMSKRRRDQSFKIEPFSIPAGMLIAYPRDALLPNRANTEEHKENVIFEPENHPITGEELKETFIAGFST